MGFDLNIKAIDGKFYLGVDPSSLLRSTAMLLFSNVNSLLNYCGRHQCIIGNMIRDNTDREYPLHECCRKEWP